MGKYGLCWTNAFSGADGRYGDRCIGDGFNVTKRKGETTVFLERGVVQLDFLSGLLDFESQVSEDTKKKDTPKQTISEKTMKMEPGEVVTYSSQTRKLEKTVDLDARDLTEW